MATPLRIGLIGFGNIGSGVIQALRDNRDLLDARCPRPLQLCRVADIDLERPRSVEVDRELLTDDAEAVVRDRAIDVVVELIGGLEPARKLVERALRAGKHVVTANKAMLAQHGAELLALAAEKKVRLLFEAAVGGGMPVIRVLTDCLAANRITRIEGILNGTCNYILGLMEGERCSLQDAVAEAQKLGYAEPDPTADIEGIDAANKIAILASLAFGVDIRLDDVYREGIRNILPTDLLAGRKSTLGFKLYALAEMNEEGRVTVSVRPTILLDENHPLARLPDVLNGVLITGTPVGTIQLVGLGAGPQPTASAVLSDLMWLAQLDDRASVPPPFLTIPVGKKPTINADYPYSGYWMRIMEVREGCGLAEIAQILARCAVPIEAMWEGMAGIVPNPEEPHHWTKVAEINIRSVPEENIRCAVEEIEAAQISKIENGILVLPNLRLVS